MTHIAVVASRRTFIASLGAMVDAHSRLGEPFAANPALGDYAQMQTSLAIVPAAGEEVVLAGGRTMKADASLKTVGRPRLIYLPSFQFADPDEVAAITSSYADLHGWLDVQHSGGALIGACGTSVCHLAAAGLLDGQAAAVHPRLVTSFRTLFPAVKIDTLNSVVQSRQLVMCGPDLANARLVTMMLSNVFGVESVRNLAMREPTSEAATDPTVDPLLAEARMWIRDRFARSLRISDMAAALGVSHQTLLRRFRMAGEGSPRTFVQKIRMDAAASMLRETQRPVSEIAQLVGFTDIASFRLIFTRHMKQSPSRYRKAARTDGESRQPT